MLENLSGKTNFELVREAIHVLEEYNRRGNDVSSILTTLQVHLRAIQHLRDKAHDIYDRLNYGSNPDV